MFGEYLKVYDHAYETLIYQQDLLGLDLVNQNNNLQKHEISSDQYNLEEAYWKDNKWYHAGIKENFDDNRQVSYSKILANKKIYFYGDAILLQIMRFIASVIDRDYEVEFFPEDFFVRQDGENEGILKPEFYDSSIFLHMVPLEPTKIYLEKSNTTLFFLASGPPTTKSGFEFINFMDTNLAINRMMDFEMGGSDTIVVLNHCHEFTQERLEEFESWLLVLKDTLHMYKQKNPTTHIIYKTPAYLRGNLSEFPEGNNFYVNYKLRSLIQQVFSDKQDLVRLYDTWQMTEVICDFLSPGSWKSNGKYWVLQSIVDGLVNSMVKNNKFEKIQATMRNLLKEGVIG